MGTFKSVPIAELLTPPGASVGSLGQRQPSVFPHSGRFSHLADTKRCSNPEKSSFPSVVSYAFVEMTDEARVCRGQWHTHPSLTTFSTGQGHDGPIRQRPWSGSAIRVSPRGDLAGAQASRAARPRATKRERRAPEVDSLAFSASPPRVVRSECSAPPI